MTSNDKLMRGEVKAFVPTMIVGVSKENTRVRTEVEFVDFGGGGKRIAKAPKNTKVFVFRGAVVKEGCWGFKFVEFAG